MLEQPAASEANEPALKLAFLSHGTLEARDLDATRRFYEQFLGLQVVRSSPQSITIRLGGDHVIVVVANPKKRGEMPLLNHNGLDVRTREEVDRCYQIVLAEQERWGIKKVTRPVDQHGTRSFYFCDLDDNWWEILVNPPGGYSWQFSKGTDLENWGSQDVNPNAFTQPTRR
jgi:catechol-2,3-dioxygenase